MQHFWQTVLPFHRESLTLITLRSVYKPVVLLAFATRFQGFHSLQLLAWRKECLYHTSISNNDDPKRLDELQMQQQFTYPTRLSSSSSNTIRLLKLHPSPLSIPLTCSFHPVSLSGYETLEVSR